MLCKYTHICAFYQLLWKKFDNKCEDWFIPNRSLGRMCEFFSTAWSLSVFIRHLLHKLAIRVRGFWSSVLRIRQTVACRDVACHVRTRMAIVTLVISALCGRGMPRPYRRAFLG